MRKITTTSAFILISFAANAQTYDSTTLVDTNNTSTSTSTVTSTNTNTNTNVNTSTSTVNSTSVNTNNNVNSGDQTIRNINSGDQTIRNINSGEQTFNNNNQSTSINTNNNNNINTSTSDNTNRNIQSGELTNRNINDSTIEQTMRSPPPTAVAPPMMSGGNSDLCTTGTSGAVQTQILGVSSGSTVRDLNCERLKNAKTLFDMGMKVAAVATLCQDRRVFDAMWHAGTPCPYEGQIGEKAKIAWNENPDKIPQREEIKGDDFYRKTGFGALLGALLFRIF
jgi:hypothetical protein